MDDASGDDRKKSSWQQFHESQMARLSAPWDRQNARQRAVKALFGGSPDLAAGTVGASPTDDPVGAEADLQKELQNEQQLRLRARATKNLYGFGE
jgi:hypothetical protein